MMDGSEGLKRSAGESLKNNQSEPKRRLTANVDIVKQQLAEIRKLRGKGVLSREQTLDILHGYFGVCQENFANNAKTGKADSANAFERTSNLLGYSIGTISAITKQWSDNYNQPNHGKEDNRVRSSKKRGNFSSHKTRIPMTKRCHHLVRDFIRTKRQNLEPVNVTQVLDLLMQKEIVTVKKDLNLLFDKKDMAAALRSVSRFVARCGFVRNRKSNSLSVSEEVIVKRNLYLRTIIANRTLPPEEQLREVYLDETYIHENFRRNPDSPYDANDEQDILFQKSNKGKRYCILAAIQSQSAKSNDPASMVPNSSLSFCPHNPTLVQGDFHKSFSPFTFTTWWTDQLLPNLSEPSLIVMDNVAYHLAKPQGVPNPNKMKKIALMQALTDRNVTFDPSTTAAEMRVILKKWISSNVEPEVVQLARQAGHQVVFLPSQYCDLQPMRLVWEQVKHNIGLQNTPGTSLADVKTRLDAEFARLESEEGKQAIASFIALVDTTIQRFLRDIEAEDNLEDFSDEDEADNSSDDELE